MTDILKLKKNVEFRRVYKRGSSTANRYLILFWMKNKEEHNRVGFSASKKVGNSVVRNRARRLMKESFRIHSTQLKKNYDLVFIARDTIKDATYKDVEKAMRHILNKSKLLK